MGDFSILADVNGTYPLTPMQSAMLFHSLLKPHCGTYLEQVVCDLHEPLNPGILERSWNEVIQRQTALRTTFHIDQNDGPVQRILQCSAMTLPVEDWANLTPEIQEAKFESLVERDLQKDFDLGVVPMRWWLLQLGPATFRLVWTFHHALLDGRSTRLALKEVFARYDAGIGGRRLRLKPSVPFRDYALWLRRRNTPDLKTYWQKQLRDCPRTQLPTERAASTNVSRGCETGVVETRLSYEISEKLRAAAQEHGLTMNTLVQGAWAQVLSRHSDSEDVVFGATRALRHSGFDGVQELVGLLINTVPVRIAVPPDTFLLRWLKELRAQWIGMRPYECASLSEILKWAESSPDAPLFSSLVVCENSSLNTAMHESAANSDREFRNRSVTSFPLTVVAFAEPEWILKIGFQRSHFDESTVRQMLGHLQELLERTPDELHRPLKCRSLLTEGERRKLLVTWQQTEKRFPREDCVHRLFEEQVERTPEAMAVDCPGDSLSFFELNQRANRLAHQLRRCGVREDSLVGVCLPRSANVVAAMLAIQKSGGAYLPLDPANPPSRFASIVQQAGLSVIVTVAELAGLCSEAAIKIICLDTDANALANEPASNPISDAGLDHTAYAVFTSGSTGQPKGILVPHRALTNHSWALIEQYGISAVDRRLQLASTSSDVLIAEVFPYLLTGGTIVVRPDLNAASIAEFVKCLDEARITIVGAPSALWHEWVLSFAEQDAPLPKSLRVVISGMDQVRPDLFAIWRKKVRRQLRWFNAYGPSEATCTTTVYEADLASDEVLHCVPIGRPISNVRVYLLDKDGNPVPVGIPGEIHIGGHGLARGYLNLPELTTDRFLQDPFGDDPHARLYRTGDLARYREDGNIEFLGRADQQVKLRGYRIELGEIESALNEHPDVAQSVVILREDRPGDTRLVAYCVPTPETSLNSSALRRHLRSRLPDYLLPAGIVVLDKLPRTSSGKVDRRALPAPDTSRPELETSRVAPRTPVERQLAVIWCEILGVETVSVDDNFFEMGGNSLTAVKLFDRIARVCGQNLPLAVLFECPTIERLAGILIERNWTPSWTSLIPIQPNGSKPPLFLIPPAAGSVLRFAELARCLGEDQPVYGLEPLGSDDRHEPLVRVEDMASWYLKEIRELQPTGPSLLAGICFGSHVAWEMARQLRESGEPVALVAILDFGPPANGPTWSKSRSLGAFARRAAGLLIPDNFFRLVRSNLGRLWKCVQRNGRRELRMRAAARRALRSYRARPLASRVLFVQSEEHSQTRMFYERWAELATGDFEHIIVPGTTHRDLLLGTDFTPTLARILRENLDLALTEPTSTESSILPLIVPPAKKSSFGERRSA